MTKYARVVFEIPIKDDDGEDHIIDAMEAHIAKLAHESLEINDIEIHDRAYIADECNSDPITTKEESI